jgi:hypothetical protein
MDRKSELAGLTDEDKIEVSARGVNRRLLLATAGKATR